MSRVERRVTLAPARDGRLAPYGVVALGALGAAAFAGEPTLALLAVPFVLALALGLRRTDPVAVTARVFLDADRVLEGDVVTGRLLLEWEGAYDAQVMLHRLDGVAPGHAEEVSASRRGATSIELPVRLEALHWGRHSLGEVWLRLAVPFGLVSWTGKVLSGPPIRVLPTADRLRRLLDPHESRAVWGAHPSRRLGDGHEFAELRPYAPGDRLRDLNWAATARHRQPFVNKHHPELAADVVIALDAFDDGSAGASEMLARAARAAWALASVHLAANDRLGLVGLGRTPHALLPAGGRLARYRLLDMLLRIGGEAAAHIMRRRGRTTPPAGALVIALTPLHDPWTVRVLEAWRARGRPVAVVVVEAPSPEGAESPAEALARRVWAVELGRRKHELASLGIPVVTAPADSSVASVVGALRRTPGVRSAPRGAARGAPS